VICFFGNRAIADADGIGIHRLPEPGEASPKTTA
jgi:hypothetical protein